MAVPLQAMATNDYNYSEEHIRTLDWIEHMRLRPGMYIGKLGDGTSPDDGIYILVKEVIDNAIDEYMMGFGKKSIFRLISRKCQFGITAGAFPWAK